ncbi:hypothetical protein J2785_007253 [Burkholderia ambifaria]|nr:hypothetical protein [Burkholderia ambifaria]
MQLVVFLALILDIPAYHFFVAMLTHRAREISICPELTAPQRLLHLWASPKYFPRRDALENRHDPRHAVGWNRLDQEMNVVLVRPYLQEFHLVALRYLQTNFFQNFINLVIKDRSSILRRQHHVARQHRDIVALVNVFAHSPQPTPQAAENRTRRD